MESGRRVVDSRRVGTGGEGGGEGPLVTQSRQEGCGQVGKRRVKADFIRGEFLIMRCFFQRDEWGMMCCRTDRKNSMPSGRSPSEEPKKLDTQPLAHTPGLEFVDEVDEGVRESLLSDDGVARGEEPRSEEVAGSCHRRVSAYLFEHRH